MMKAIGYISVTIFVVVYSTLTYSAALVKLWEWFIAPKFGLPQLGLLEAIGFTLTAHFIAHQTNDHEKTETVSFGELLIKATFTATLRPILVLAIGGTVKALM